MFDPELGESFVAEALPPWQTSEVLMLRLWILPCDREVGGDDLRLGFRH